MARAHNLWHSPKLLKAKKKKNQIKGNEKKSLKFCLRNCLPKILNEINLFLTYQTHCYSFTHHDACNELFLLLNPNQKFITKYENKKKNKKL